MFQVTQNQPRMLGCKAPEPLSFSVCGQLISPSGFLHHRRCFTETVLILVTEGSLYLKFLCADCRSIYPASGR